MVERVPALLPESPSGWTTFQLGSHVFIGSQSEKDVRAGTRVFFLKQADMQSASQATRQTRLKLQKQADRQQRLDMTGSQMMGS